MGIEDRDYIRRPTGGGFGGHWDSPGLGLTPVCKWLVIANIAIYVLQLIWTRPPTTDELREGADRQGVHLTAVQSEQLERLDARERQLLARQWKLEERVSPIQKWLEMDLHTAVYRGQIWRFVTYAFCHSRSDPWHIIINMWVLWMFGPALERMYGSREFLWFYLAGAVISAVTFLTFGLALRDIAPMIGASGAVVASLMLFAWHFPRHTILLFFVIPVEIRWLVLLYVAFELHPILLRIGGNQVLDHIAHSAHLGGLAFGWLYGKYNLQIGGLLPQFRWPPARRRLLRRSNIRLYEPPSEDLNEQVDRILQKIHEQGESSLTDQERAVLKTASQRYKRR